MPFLVGRAVMLAAGGVVGFAIQRTVGGALIGLGVAVVIVLLEVLIAQVKLDVLVIALIGLVLGIVAAQVLDYLFFAIDVPQVSDGVRRYIWVIRLGFSYLGIVLAVRKKSELDLLDTDVLKGSKAAGKRLMLMDTSMIIDGRIVDLYETRFIDGPLIVPKFVLRELQYLADSQDHNKRVRAKRGLEMLTRLKDAKAITMLDIDYLDIREIDARLIKLARDINGRILTVDYNLNKVAALEGVTVLNINDLANALKPVYTAGERFAVFVLKEGKDHNQGVGYLDDGTMVVVDDGRRHIGRKIDVTVTSTLQTSSGRIIFTKPS